MPCLVLFVPCQAGPLDRGHDPNTMICPVLFVPCQADPLDRGRDPNTARCVGPSRHDPFRWWVVLCLDRANNDVIRAGPTDTTYLAASSGRSMLTREENKNLRLVFPNSQGYLHEHQQVFTKKRIHIQPF